VTVVEALQLGNPTLRERSKPVLDLAFEKIGKLRDDLADTLRF